MSIGNNQYYYCLLTEAGVVEDDEPLTLARPQILPLQTQTRAAGRYHRSQNPQSCFAACAVALCATRARRVTDGALEFVVFEVSAVGCKQ